MHGLTFKNRDTSSICLFVVRLERSRHKSNALERNPPATNVRERVRQTSPCDGNQFGAGKRLLQSHSNTNDVFGHTTHDSIASLILASAAFLGCLNER